jgi:hypothetical protein
VTCRIRVRDCDGLVKEMLHQKKAISPISLSPLSLSPFEEEIKNKKQVHRVTKGGITINLNYAKEQMLTK